MEYKCLNPKCKKVFRPHPFIGMRHPSRARCPVCDSKGKITELGIEIRKSRFHETNKANARANRGITVRD